MKRCLALLISIAILLTGCSSTQINTQSESANQVTQIQEPTTSIEETNDVLQTIEETLSTAEPQTVDIAPDVTFTGLDDKNLLTYVEDSIYLQLLNELDSDEYVVEGVEAIYYPKEYISELAFNSQENVYFGYTPSELNAQFRGTRYVFTLGDDGTTAVVPMETLNSDAYEHVLDNIVIGSGVILICVTVSVVTAGAAPAVSAIFAASAKTATSFALSTSAISAASAAITTGYQTENVAKSLEAAIVSGSEGFKWGAIIGATTGGGKEAFALHKGTAGGLTMNQVAIIQKETGYPMELISQIKTIEEYNVYKEAGLYTKMVNGKLALVRNIDLDFVSELPNGERVTNLLRMQKGYAPIDPLTEKPYQLHHIGQSVDSPLAILSSTEHTGAGNNGILHDLFIADGEGVHANLSNAEWAAQRSEFWIKFAASVL